MAQQGWIKLYRKIKENDLWNDKPYDRAHAWIDLILSANHQENNILLGNEFICVEKGSFITSEYKLMDRWGWSKTKVRAFLLLLSNQNMLIKKSDRKKTTLTIVNYTLYQEIETTEKPLKNYKKTTEKLLKNLNKNEENEKNEKNDNNIYSFDSNEYKLSQFLYNNILVNNKDAKEPDCQKWSKQFNDILRIDKRELEQVKSVIVFAQKNNFWMANILSPKKLREKYETLFMQMKNEKKPLKNVIKGNFNNYSQREYDFENLETQLLAKDKTEVDKEPFNLREQLENLKK